MVALSDIRGWLRPNYVAKQNVLLFTIPFLWALGRPVLSFTVSGLDVQKCHGGLAHTQITCAAVRMSDF